MSSDTDIRILEAALAIVGTKGAAALTMEDVATAAGVSRQAVYLHFKTRARLLTALAAHVDATRGLHRLRRKVMTAKTPLEALRAVVELQATYFPRIREIALALEAARYTDEAAGAAWNERMAERRAQLTKLIARLARERLLDAAWTEGEAIDFLVALSSIKVWESLVVERGWSKKRYVEHIERVLVSALTPAAAAKGRRGSR